MNNGNLLPTLAIDGSKNKANSYRNKSSLLKSSGISTEEYNPFKSKLEKVLEIKIFLKQNFHKSDIDDNFLADLDLQYAMQFLEKMDLLGTKSNIKKLLKLKPIDKCDFSLTVEQIRNKPVKLLHIYPNPKQNVQRTNLKTLLSNEEFEKVMNKTFLQVKEGSDDKFAQIKNREIKKDEMNLYMPEMIENIINKAKEDIQDRKIYFQSHGMIEKHGKVFDLSINAIREKFIIPNSQIILDSKDTASINSKARLQNIEKANKKDIFNNPKYEFPYLDVEINKEILKEVDKPIEVPLEVIMKDINYILDNFPIDKLINLEDPFKKNQNLLIENANADDPFNLNPPGQKKLNHNDSFKSIDLSNQNITTKLNQFYKIKSVSRNDVLLVYKKIESPAIYRIVGLLVNLLYWTVFGFVNRIQPDQFTKQHIFFKILEELHEVELNFGNKKVFDKLFMPIFIIVMRIEMEAIFHKKFKVFFDNPEIGKKALKRINEIISITFDPNFYYNTFTVLSSDLTKLKHKISKNLYPRYKSKVNATSNFINELFSKSSNDKNDKNKINDPDKLDMEWETERKYIYDCKTEFYKVLLNKVNQNLKKRNLDPIFNVSKNNKEIPALKVIKENKYE